MYFTINIPPILTREWQQRGPQIPTKSYFKTRPFAPTSAGQAVLLASPLPVSGFGLSHNILYCETYSPHTQRDNFVSYKCLDTLTNHIPNTGYPHPSQTLKDHQPPGSLLALSPLELETPPLPEGTTASLSWHRPRPSHSSSTWVILHVFELYTHWGHTVFSLASVNTLSGG